MSKPDFSGFKEVQQNAWKTVFQRLDRLESQNRDLLKRIEKLEEV